MDKLTEYLKYREKIRTGDAILWKGKGIISWLIRRWSKYSHASLVIRLHKYKDFVNRVFMVEALSHGLKLTLLSKRIKDYDGEVFWLPVKMDEGQRVKTIRYALVECAETDGYDYEGLFKNVFGRVSQDADKVDPRVCGGDIKTIKQGGKIMGRSPRVRGRLLPSAHVLHI